jgi:acetamidase/formamidase
VTHYLEDLHHCRWDAGLESVLTVDPGDIVVFRCTERAGGQFTSDSTVEVLDTLDFDRIHTLIAAAGRTRGCEPNSSTGAADCGEMS